MSHVGDTSNPISDDHVTPRSTSRSGIASSYSVVGESATKKLKFNEHGLPIGPNSAKSASRLGSLARTHVPICYTTWIKVPIQYKDQLWKAYKDEYPDVKESQRDLLMGKAGIAWKKFKSKLQQHLEGDDLTKWKERVPQNIKSEDWEAYCDHEATPNQKDLRKRNKAIKDNSERKSTHNTGCDGYARAAEKWEQKNGRPPTHAELWLDTHRKKDGTYAPHDKKFAEKVEMLLKLFREKGDEETIDYGPIYDTFGKDTRGRVRCIGTTVSRKAVLASSFAREMLKEVNIVRDEWMEKVDNLKKEMEGVKSTLTEFINDFKNGKFASVGHNVHITSPTTAMPTSVTTHAPSTATPTPTLNDLIPCKIQSHMGEIVGYGRKAQLGAITLVHGHCLRPREVRVVLDNIKVPEYSVWGGKQGPCSTLADVGKGGFMYWHDDLLPPLDDTREQ